jgi:hypothetical protein
MTRLRQRLIRVLASAYAKASAFAKATADTTADRSARSRSPPSRKRFGVTWP